MRRIIPVCILILYFAVPVYGQQAPVYSQYILNEFIINPSVAGIDGMTTINLTGRKQWVGFQHAPETYSASISGRVLKSPFSVSKGKVSRSSKGRVGLGMAFLNDRNGAINRTNLKLTYAYHIFIQNYQLSLGLDAMLGQFSINRDLIDFRDPDDAFIAGIVGKSAYFPDAGAGINFSAPRGHLGLAASNLFRSRIKFGDISVNPTQLNNIIQFLGYGVYKFQLGKPNWEFEPSVFLRGNQEWRFNADLTGRLIYHKEYWAGLSIRTTGDFILLLGLKVNRFYMGYSFDYGINQLSRSSYGSHEIVMAVKLGDSLRRYRWLERY
jgi:type IX secretion system PorP/SprF family membrane protein